MTALREFVKVENHKIVLDLPHDFNYDNVEIIIMPKQEQEWDYWSDQELKDVGNIGLLSSSFEEDPEDYSKW